MQIYFIVILSTLYIRLFSLIYKQLLQTIVTLFKIKTTRTIISIHNDQATTFSGMPVN